MTLAPPDYVVLALAAGGVVTGLFIGLSGALAFFSGCIAASFVATFAWHFFASFISSGLARGLAVALASLVGSETFLAMFRKAVGVGLFYEISAIDAAVPRRIASQRSHVALLEALRDAKTADEAEAAIREHLNSGKSALGVK